MPDVIINGPAGRIEGRYLSNSGQDAGIALILHPHPQHGGTMNNKVVYTMYNTFARQGFSVLRFNFRGVGRSQGEFDNGEGELSDAAAALDWLQNNNPNAKSCWIAGFSFGSWIAMQLLMRRPEIESFVSVGLPANMYDFSFLAPCPTSGLVVHGQQDTVVPKDSVEKLLKKLSHQRGINLRYEIMDHADHYFNNHLDRLSQIIEEYVQDFAKRAKAPATARRRQPGNPRVNVQEILDTMYNDDDDDDDAEEKN